MALVTHGGRLDAESKATGSARYAADLHLDGLLHATAVRSPYPRAQIRGIDAGTALRLPGVVAVYSASDVTSEPYGRHVRDIPVLAQREVRFCGERVAVVVAEDRRVSERAAALVEVDLEELPAVIDPDEAVQPGASLVHERAWAYPGASVSAADGPNKQSCVRHGDRSAVHEALRTAAFEVEETYSVPAVHQGYLEPQVWTAAPLPGNGYRLWATTKSPYRLRDQLSICLGVPAELLVVEPTVIGGDFGGKGAPGEAPLCLELVRLTGRPVRIALRYGDDLTATDARHPARIRVRIGCDDKGLFVGLSIEARFDGGAYAGFKPAANANLHGALEGAAGYRVPQLYAESVIAYTNTVPKGHMRSPGAPQITFAIESALDELARRAAIDPVDLRRLNLLAAGDTNPYGRKWSDVRGSATLDAAVAASVEVKAPMRWKSGRGLAVYARETPPPGGTSLRLRRHSDQSYRVDVPIPETGTGSHSVVRERLAAELGIAAGDIEVVQVATSRLPIDRGVGGSWVTAGMSSAVEALVDAWRQRAEGCVEVSVELGVADQLPVVSYAVQVATVALDPETGQLRVLDILTAVDVGGIVNPKAHQMQIDGGAVMGFGYALLEDLLEDEGRIWAANLGDFKLPTSADVPTLRTVVVGGGQGFGRGNVKGVGELTNVPTAAAIANAIADASGCRLRNLPLTAEKLYWELGARALRTRQRLDL